jgi:hypothetical protein
MFMAFLPLPLALAMSQAGKRLSYDLNALTTLKAATLKGRSPGGSAEEVNDDAATVCHFLGSAVKVGFPDDCK